MATASLQHTGRFDCPVCPHRFHTLHEKKQHLRTQHPKPAKQ